MNQNTNKSQLPKYLPALYPSLLCLAVGFGLWFGVPTPTGMNPEGWHLLIIFSTTILGVIIKPMPMGALCMVTTVIAILTHTLKIEQALSGFQDKVLWLIVLALFIARGFTETGLGNRIGYGFTRLLGKRTLGLGYGLASTDLILAPAVPSVTGRSAGIVHPIMQAIARSFDSLPHSASARKIGGYLVTTCFQATVLSSTMFLTAMAGNPLLKSLALDYAQIDITWGTWAVGAIVPGLVCFILVPLFIYWIYPPTLKDTPMAPKFAAEQLQKMGPMSVSEWIMAFTVVLLLTLWIGGGYFKIDPLLAAFIGFSCLVVGGVLNWKQLMQDETVWETFIWFAILVMMAKYLGELQVIHWFKDTVHVYFHNIQWEIAFPIITLVYFYTHYFFASSVAHISAMFPPFLTLAISLGTPPMLAILMLCYASNLMGGLTHYSLGPAPALFASGYVDIKDWWRIGFLVSVLNLIIFSTVGLMWWKVLGFW